MWEPDLRFFVDVVLLHGAEEGCRDPGLVLRVESLEFRVQGLGLEFRVEDLGFGS